MRKTARFNFFPVSYDPLVIYTFTGFELGLGNVFYMSRSIEQKTASFIVGFTGYALDWKLRYLRRQLDAYQSRYPHNHIVLIANTEEELDRMRHLGLDARFVNKNAFQREDQFTIKKGVNKIYDSVMNARTLRLKRMELARNVDPLAVITVVDNEEYFWEMRSVLAYAEWVNFDRQGDYSYLSRSEVCKILNQSRTGLILSAHEGNNKASIEYLLSGIPVVSTSSLGGRDVFFDEDYCAIVEATAEAVGGGVESMVTRDIDPEYIRQQTLDKIRDHRARFLSLVSHLTDGHYEASVDDWLDLYPRNMKFRCQPEHFRAFLESDYLTERPEHTSEFTLREERPGLWHSMTSDKDS
jgi:glycosyltransferase involved in cell wall biosynthesis